MGDMNEVFREELVRLTARNSVAALDDVLANNPAWSGWVAGIEGGAVLFGMVRGNEHGSISARATAMIGFGLARIRSELQFAIDIAEHLDEDGARAWLERCFRKSREWRESALTALAKEDGVGRPNVRKLLWSSPLDRHEGMELDGAPNITWTARDGWPGPEAGE